MKFKALLTAVAVLALSAPAYAGMHHEHGGPGGGEHHGGPEGHMGGHPGGFEGHPGGHFGGHMGGPEFHHGEHFGFHHGEHFGGGRGWGWRGDHWWWHGHRFVPGTYGGTYFAEPNPCLVWSEEYGTWVIIPGCDGY